MRRFSWLVLIMTKNMGRDFWRTSDVVNNKSNIKIQFKLGKLLISCPSLKAVTHYGFHLLEYCAQWHNVLTMSPSKNKHRHERCSDLRQRTWSQLTTTTTKKRVTKVGLVLKKNEMLTFQKKVRIRPFHNHQSFHRFLVKKSNIYIK